MATRNNIAAAMGAGMGDFSRHLGLSALASLPLWLGVIGIALAARDLTEMAAAAIAGAVAITIAGIAALAIVTRRSTRIARDHDLYVRQSLALVDCMKEINRRVMQIESRTGLIGPSVTEAALAIETAMGLPAAGNDLPDDAPGDLSMTPPITPPMATGAAAPAAQPAPQQAAQAHDAPQQPAQAQASLVQAVQAQEGPAPMREALREAIREPIRDPVQQPMQAPVQELVQEALLDALREPQAVAAPPLPKLETTDICRLDSGAPDGVRLLLQEPVLSAAQAEALLGWLEAGSTPGKVEIILPAVPAARDQLLAGLLQRAGAEPALLPRLLLGVTEPQLKTGGAEQMRAVAALARAGMGLSLHGVADLDLRGERLRASGIARVVVDAAWLTRQLGAAPDAVMAWSGALAAHGVTLAAVHVPHRRMAELLAAFDVSLGSGPGAAALPAQLPAAAPAGAPALRKTG